MIITSEIAERLKQNLLFGPDTTDAQGAIQILFRGEDQESVKELYSLLQALTQADFIIGQEVQLPEFVGQMSLGPTQAE